MVQRGQVRVIELRGIKIQFEPLMSLRTILDFKTPFEILALIGDFST